MRKTIIYCSLLLLVFSLLLPNVANASSFSDQPPVVDGAFVVKLDHPSASCCGGDETRGEQTKKSICKADISLALEKPNESIGLSKELHFSSLPKFMKYFIIWDLARPPNFV